MRFAIGFLGLLLLAGSLQAQVLEENIVRPTRHSQNWVPSTLYQLMAFTADGPEATVIFSAQVRSTETSSWLRQAVDNVAVTTRAVYDAHLVPRNQSDLGNYFWLQNEPSYPIFFFDHTSVNPADFRLFDQFGSGVDGWDTTVGAYWIDPTTNFNFNPASAPTNDLDDPSNTSGGALGLGDENFALATASSRKLVTGLTPGVQYVLSFWWNAQNDNIDENGDPNPNGDLFITILGSEVVGVQPATWSGIKSMYRP